MIGNLDHGWNGTSARVFYTLSCFETMLWPKVATCELVAKRGAHLIQGEQSTGQRSIEVVRHQERLHLPEQVGRAFQLSSRAYLFLGLFLLKDMKVPVCTSEACINPLCCHLFSTAGDSVLQTNCIELQHEFYLVQLSNSKANCSCCTGRMHTRWATFLKLLLSGLSL